MTRGEAEMLALNFIGLENVELMKKYQDKSISEVLECEFGDVGRFIELDDTRSIDTIHEWGRKKRRTGGR